MFLLDAPGTVITVAAEDGQRQADVLNELCGSRVASSSFVPREVNTGFSDWVLSAGKLYNNTTSNITRALTATTTTSTTTGLKIEVNAKLSIAKVLEIGFKVEYSHIYQHLDILRDGNGHSQTWRSRLSGVA